MPTNVDIYIDFFEKIPEEDWCVFKKKNNFGQRCAIGHLSKGGSDFYYKCSGLFWKYLGTSITSINDDCMGTLKHYGYTPKERVLNALHEIKKLQQEEQRKQI